MSEKQTPNKLREEILQWIRGNDRYSFNLDSQNEYVTDEIMKLVEDNNKRFIKPTYQQLVEFAILINEGKIEREKLADMVAMATMIIDRLYENGNILIKSKQEIEDENPENDEFSR